MSRQLLGCVSPTWDIPEVLTRWKTRTLFSCKAKCLHLSWVDKPQIGLTPGVALPAGEMVALTIVSRLDIAMALQSFLIATVAVNLLKASG